MFQKRNDGVLKRPKLGPRTGPSRPSNVKSDSILKTIFAMARVGFAIFASAYFYHRTRKTYHGTHVISIEYVFM